MGSRLERTERLLNLVFCLMAAQRPVPRATIRASVAGYDPEATTEAFERMFERDKEELRGMGIPVDTVLDVNGDVAGYRIVPATYRLIDIELSSAERAAIALAARVWEGAALSHAASLAVLKIAASGSDGDVPAVHLPQFARLTAEDTRLLPILRSAREGRAIAFAYRGVQDPQAIRRHVDPWAIVARDGRWYLIAHDRDRVAARAFRLSRIEGDVTVTADSIAQPRPDDFDPEAYITLDPVDPMTATVTLVPGGGSDLMRRASTEITTPEGTLVTVTADRETLVGLLTASMRHIHAITPTELAAEISDRLQRVVTNHRGDANGD